MSTVVTEPEAIQSDAEHDPSVPDVALLEDKMPDWFRTPPSFAGFAVLVSLTFVMFNVIPLSHTDLWGHLSYGRLIWEAGALPTTEPLMPLSQGVPFVDTAWLTQLMGYGAFNIAGKAAIAFLHGLGIAVAVGFLLKRVYNKTGNSLVALLSFALFSWIAWEQLVVTRPQVAGLVFFSATIFLLTKRTWSKANWILAPVMFALWANMHGSFLVGLGLMGCFALGRAVDAVRRMGPRGIFRDNRFRRQFLLTQLSAAATLLNPYGLALFFEVIAVGQNPNLRSLIEWDPLRVTMFQGKAALAGAIALFIVYRLSPRRVSAAEPIALIVFGVAMLFSSRLILWWAPLAAYFFGLHAAAILGARKGSATEHTKSTQTESEDDELSDGRASLWTLVAGFIFLIGFEMSHVGGMLLDKAVGKDPAKRMERVTVTPMTPVLATQYLRKNPPKGLVFNTYELGDYLTWAGPKGMQLFVNSHAHLVPEHVWNDYLYIINLNANWSSRLDRYGINTIVIDQAYRKPMIQRLLENADWRQVYSDNATAVFKRRNPI